MTEQEALCRSIGEQAGLGACLVGPAGSPRARRPGRPRPAALPRFEAYRAWGRSTPATSTPRPRARPQPRQQTSARWAGGRRRPPTLASVSGRSFRRMGDGAPARPGARTSEARIALPPGEGPTPAPGQPNAHRGGCWRPPRPPTPPPSSCWRCWGSPRHRPPGAGRPARILQQPPTIYRSSSPSPPSSATRLTVATAQVNLGNAVTSRPTTSTGGVVTRRRAGAAGGGGSPVLVPLLNNRWQVHMHLGEPQPQSPT